MKNVRHRYLLFLFVQWRNRNNRKIYFELMNLFTGIIIEYQLTMTYRNKYMIKYYFFAFKSTTIFANYDEDLLQMPINEIPPRSEKQKFKEIEKFISIIELLSFLFSVTAEFKKIKKFNNVHITRITNTLNHSGIQGIREIYLHHCYSQSRRNSRKSRNLTQTLNLYHHYSQSRRNSRKSRNLTRTLIFLSSSPSTTSEFKEIIEIKKFNSNIEFVSSLLSITSEFKKIKEIKK